MKQNFEIAHARSRQDGIIFYSNILPVIGYKTYLDENDEIQKDITLDQFDESVCIKFSQCSKQKNPFKKWMFLAFMGFIISIGIITSILFKTPGPIISALYFSAFALYEIYKMINSAYLIQIKDEKDYSLAKFHAAEHMAINAYQKLKRIPTLEEIKSFSRFSKNCGTMPRLNKIAFLSIFSIILITWTMPIFFILAIFYIVFMFLAMVFGWFKFLQILVTSKPTDKELIIAIEGLKFFEEMEEFKQRLHSRIKSADENAP